MTSNLKINRSINLKIQKKKDMSFGIFAAPTPGVFHATLTFLCWGFPSRGSIMQFWCDGFVRDSQYRLGLVLWYWQWKRNHLLLHTSFLVQDSRAESGCIRANVHWTSVEAYNWGQRDTVRLFKVKECKSQPFLTLSYPHNLLQGKIKFNSLILLSNFYLSIL